MNDREVHNEVIFFSSVFLSCVLEKFKLNNITLFLNNLKFKFEYQKMSIRINKLTF